MRRDPGSAGQRYEVKQKKALDGAFRTSETPPETHRDESDCRAYGSTNRTDEDPPPHSFPQRGLRTWSIHALGEQEYECPSRQRDRDLGGRCSEYGTPPGESPPSGHRRDPQERRQHTEEQHDQNAGELIIHIRQWRDVNVCSNASNRSVQYCFMRVALARSGSFPC